MGKVDKTFKPTLNEQSDAFNDAGEPMMTHSQFRDYSEPAEPDYDSDRYIPQFKSGIGNFRDINWKTLHGIFVQNTEAFKQGKIGDSVTINELIDYDGYLTNDELTHLDNWNLVYIDGQFVVIDDDQYLNYETFYNKAQEIWEKDPPYESSGNDSEAPYLRGYEPMSESKKRLFEVMSNVNPEIIQEGAWGHYPLDNDAVSDWKWEFGEMILKELKNKLKGDDLSYQYYAIGLWKFFKERLKTQYSFFSDEDIEEMDKLTNTTAKKLLQSDFMDSYDEPDKVKIYLKNYMNQYLDECENFSIL